MRATGHQSKDQLRQDAYEKRLQLSEAQRAQASAQMTENFLKNVRLPEKGAVVSGYMPFNAEIDVRPLMTHLQGEGYTCVIPHVRKDLTQLDFRTWRPDAPLQRNIYGIEEADPDNSEILLPDLMIVPLVAFDARGNRMGYGSGQFDRSFAELTKVKKFFAVGVAYDSQRYEDVPIDAHDHPLDMVVTDTAVYNCRENRA
ncbi:MAG: 5-formyltetrahydrofolate cyclo-ligase [Alphaproteobacteria bacterium]|nr:5-formyltetrahydrofolate cyclo-ligase [Alphaproteobacteria bacterium]